MPFVLALVSKINSKTVLKQTNKQKPSQHTKLLHIFKPSFFFFFPLKILTSSPKKSQQWEAIIWIYIKCLTYIKKNAHSNLPALSIYIRAKREAILGHTTNPTSR